MARRKHNENGADDPIVIPLDSFHHNGHLVMERSTYRSNHEAVRDRPDHFAPWLTTTTGELEELKRQLAKRERVRAGLPE